MNLRIQKLQTDLMAANQVRDQLHTATQCTQRLCITKYFRWKQTTFPTSAVHVIVAVAKATDHFVCLRETTTKDTKQNTSLFIH